MFERFTVEAIKVIMLAQEEARRLSHNYVGSEFILLGLIGEGTGIAAKSLKLLGINLKDARAEVEKIVGRGTGFCAVEIPFTSDGKRSLEFAWDEARRLGYNYIGTEHLLLGLLRVDESTTVQVLENWGIALDKLRATIIRLMGETGQEQKKPRVTSPRRGVDLAEQIDRSIESIFKALLIALPAKAQLVALHLQEVRENKQTAIREQLFDIAATLREEEEKLSTTLRELLQKP